MPSGFTDYSKFDKIEDSDEDSEAENSKLSDAELKKKRDVKRDLMIEKELAGYKAIDDKLKLAEKLPKRVGSASELAPPAPAPSWSVGRKTQGMSEQEKNEAWLRWSDAEHVLSQLADDEDLQHDLKRPTVVKAIRHWTNEVRLSKEDANALFEEDTIEFQQYLKPALTKLSRLQTACRRAGVGVPIDALFAGRRTIFEPPPPPAPLTDAEQRQLERAELEAANKAFEERLFADLPPPTPFCWKAFAKQTAVQLVLMGGAMLYFKHYISPNLEKRIEGARLAHEAEQAATAFPFEGAYDSVEHELGAASAAPAEPLADADRVAFADDADPAAVSAYVDEF